MPTEVLYRRRPKGQPIDLASAVTRMPDDSVLVHADLRDDEGRLVHYKVLNGLIRRLIQDGERRIIIEGVTGHRYIAAAASRKDVYIEVFGTPGNDLGAFLDGPTVEVFGNAQDQTGNTMNSGKIIVHGNAWDVTGLAARGGTILIKGDTGYRVGIHMKEYAGTKPSIVVGGTAKDYLGEYMAGGTLVILNRKGGMERSPVGLNIGAGIHGGKIFVHGKVEKHQLGPGATMGQVGGEDGPELESLIQEFERAFKVQVQRDWENFVRIAPASSRPFSGHYDPTSI